MKYILYANMHISSCICTDMYVSIYRAWSTTAWIYTARSSPPTPTGTSRSSSQSQRYRYVTLYYTIYYTTYILYVTCTYTSTRIWQYNMLISYSIDHNSNPSSLSLPPSTPSFHTIHHSYTITDHYPDPQWPVPTPGLRRPVRRVHTRRCGQLR